MTTFACIMWGAILLYFWLAGWWLAGAIIFIGLKVVTLPTGQAWLFSTAIGFAPWLIRFAIRDTRRIAIERAIKRAGQPQPLRSSEPVSLLRLPHHDAGR